MFVDVGGQAAGFELARVLKDRVGERWMFHNMCPNVIAEDARVEFPCDYTPVKKTKRFRGPSGFSACKHLLKDCDCIPGAVRPFYYSSHSAYFLGADDMANVRPDGLMLARLHMFPLDRDSGSLISAGGRVLEWTRATEDFVSTINAVVKETGTAEVLHTYEHRDLSAELLAGKFQVNDKTAYPAVREQVVRSETFYSITTSARVKPAKKGADVEKRSRAEQVIVVTDPTNQSAVVSVLKRIMNIFGVTYGVAKTYYEETAAAIHEKPPPDVECWQRKKEDVIASFCLSAGIIVIALLYLIHRPMRALSWVAKSFFTGLLVLPLVALATWVWTRWEKEAVRGTIRKAVDGGVSSWSWANRVAEWLKERQLAWEILALGLQ
jgi:hypothetical protein